MSYESSCWRFRDTRSVSACTDISRTWTRTTTDAVASTSTATAVSTGTAAHRVSAEHRYVYTCNFVSRNLTVSQSAYITCIFSQLTIIHVSYFIAHRYTSRLIRPSHRKRPMEKGNSLTLSRIVMSMPQSLMPTWWQNIVPLCTVKQIRCFEYCIPVVDSWF